VNDDAKRIILARRARFIAAALAGVAAHSQACDGPATAAPCLGVPFDETAVGGSSGSGTGGSSGAGGVEPPDGFGGLGGEGGEGAGGAPEPCLSVR
jgi:hypothetical protein